MLENVTVNPINFHNQWVSIKITVLEKILVMKVFLSLFTKMAEQFCKSTTLLL